MLIRFANVKTQIDLDVSYVATVERAKIPLAQLPGPTFELATLDSVARRRLRASFGRDSRDRRALIVQAHDTQWAIWTARRKLYARVLRRTLPDFARAPRGATRFLTVPKPAVQDHSTGDDRAKLKRMIITSLRLRNMTKEHPDFRAMYTHVLQAATFALRKLDMIDAAVYERKGIVVIENLLDMFA
ncbi:hypothetical protein PYCC9005_002724 [Savitreella phatthalungensis]